MKQQALVIAGVSSKKQLVGSQKGPRKGEVAWLSGLSHQPSTHRSTHRSTNFTLSTGTDPLVPWK